MPPRLLTNADLERLVETTDEWILQRTGIRERHIVDPGVATSDLAAEAAREAICRAGLTPADIDFIVVGTTTPDMMFPSTACLVQTKIGATRAWGFDLGAACSGFTYALTTAAQMVSAGRQRARAGHRRRRHVEHHRLHRSHDVRAVRRRCGRRGRRGVRTTIDIGIIDFRELHRTAAAAMRCACPAGGSLRPASKETVDQRLHYVKQDGATVFKFAVRNTEEARVEDSRRATASSRVRSTSFVSHQANRRIILSATEKLGIPAREGRHQHRAFRQHDGGDDSARAQRRGRAEAAEAKAICCCSRRSAPVLLSAPC